MINDKVGFAVIGCGNIGPWHAAAASRSPKTALVTVCDTVEEKAKKLAEKHGCDYVTDMRRVFEDDRVDVCSICVPSGDHANVGCEAAQAGKHVLSEKPLDITLENIDRFIRTCDESGVKLATIFQRRFQRNSVRLKRAIEAGKFGKLVMCDAYLKYYRTQEYYDSGDWRGTWAMDGGGCLMNQGVHGVDLLTWLCGPVKSVYASCKIATHERIEVEDSCVAVLEFAGGHHGVIEGSTSCYNGFPTTIQVHGDAGSASWVEDSITYWKVMNGTDEDERMLEIANAAAEEVDTSDPTAMLGGLGESHRPQIEDMADAIIENRDPVCTGCDGRHSVEIILAIYQSWRTGAKVELPL